MNNRVDLGPRVYQRARAEKSEVQDLIYGGNTSNSKNFIKQNHDELLQKQRETQQKIQQNSKVSEERFIMKKFKDVKPKLTRTGMMNDQNERQPPQAKQMEQPRSRTQDKIRQQAPESEGRKLTKAEKFKQMKQQNKPLNELNQNSREPINRRSALQSAGKDITNSKPPKAKNTKPKQEPAAMSYKVGANNPPPSEQPNVVYYAPESKEDIFSLVKDVDPKKEHREKYAPRNISGPRKRATKTESFEETKQLRKEGIPAQKGIIAPKKDKNFVKSNYKEAIDEATMKVKARGTIKDNTEGEDKTKKNYGKVPTYLKKFNKERQMKEDWKAQMEADKDVPPGCKKMDEDERLETLRDLQNNKREVNSMLEKMPISMRTHALNQRKNELEDKLAEIDRAIAMFSKKVVYVSM